MSKNLVWRRHPHGSWNHLAVEGKDRGLCGDLVRAEPEPRPIEEWCCSRCWVLADIAGEAVPKVFSHAKPAQEPEQETLF